jgi:prepilin-type N-terminal cleavage/methylation domain-containing protein
MLKNKSNKGFTIIEVLIVLAIAGLILLIVFLAVPALQRNARNTANKNDASAVAAAVQEFRSNNDGKNPTAINGTGTITVGVAPDVTATAKVQGTTTVTSAAAATSTNLVTYQVNKDCAGATNNRAVAIHYWIEQAGGAGNGTKCIES